MHVDQVLATLAFQVEYLKDKLEQIREIADKAYEDRSDPAMVFPLCRIINLCDDVEVYSDKRAEY